MAVFSHEQYTTVWLEFVRIVSWGLRPYGFLDQEEVNKL